MIGWLAILALVGAAAEDPLREARRALDDPDAVQREQAVRRLARLDDARAWELVAGALADPAGSVAETAELELGRAGSEAALDALVGRAGLAARDDAVAARAAEALGRSPLAPPADALERALERAGEARVLALWALERAAREKRWEGSASVARQVERLASGGARRGDALGERTAARALACSLALGEGGLEAALGRIERALASPAAGLRAAACALAAQHLAPATAEALAGRALEDDDWRVRSAALDALARAGGLARLVERLEERAEPRPRLRARALALLREVSGLRHGADPRPWRDWLARRAEEARTGDPESGAQEARPAPPGGRVPGRSPERTPRSPGRPAETTVALERVVVPSDHVAFLFDLSGSMWMRRGGAPSRKEIADVRFAELLGRLDPRTRFLLVPYTREPHPWRDEPVAATRANVRQAADDFARCREHGAGDFWEAAQLALAADEIDTIVVLTDGVPTGGAVNRMELLARLLEERGLARRVTLDALLVGASPAAIARWSELCAATGGRCLPVELVLPEPSGDRPLHGRGGAGRRAPERGPSHAVERAPRRATIRSRWKS